MHHNIHAAAAICVPRRINFHDCRIRQNNVAGVRAYSASHFIDCDARPRRLSVRGEPARPSHSRISERTTSMKSIMTEFGRRARLRHFAAALFGTALAVAINASALAADAVTLRVGDQKGGNRSLLEIAGLAKDLPYKIEWSEFPAAAPILEALNAGALDVGYTGELAFLTVYASG